MKTLRLDLDDATRVATLTFDEPGSAVNTMCRDWQDDLAHAARRLVEMRESIRGVILASAKSTFFAGAKLDDVMRGGSLGNHSTTDASVDRGAAGRQIFADVESIKRSFRALETLGKPVVACLNGAALGGGWELALSAHARIAIDDPKVRFGTPEVTLGLIPAAGGITKTVRLLGLQGAHPLLMEGKLFSPREAAAMGLVTELVDDVAELRSRALTWIDAYPNAQQPWDTKGHKIPGGTPSSPAVAQALVVAPAMLAKKTRGLYPAPEACLAAMVEGAQVDVDTALRIESRYLAQVMPHPVTRNMISAFFFDTQAVKSGQARPKDVPRWRPKRVGIVGAGMMGAGIAHAFASRGIDCVLDDVDAARAQAGKDASRRLTDERVGKGAMTTTEQAALLARITPTGSIADLRGCDLIVEAVFEQRDLKARVTREAEPMLAEGGLFASNTSTLPITGLAAASAHPERFVGLHFFSPVHRMPLVEIIRGKATSDASIARAYDVVAALGKTPIVVNDSRGFFTSRVFGTFVMEGMAMLGDGIPAAMIENAAVAAGMPVGPLAVVDETSLSLSMHVREQARADLAAEGRAYVEAPGEAVLARMVVEFGRQGRAAGGGFYDYPADGKKRLWPGLVEAFAKRGATRGTIQDEATMQELRDRILWRQSVETARCLHEGVLTSVAEANLGSILGIGFPAWTGGALRFAYADLPRFYARADDLAQRHGPRFALDAEVRATLERFERRY